MMLSGNEWLEQLQRSGTRVTGPRRAIVGIVASSERALSPLEIFDLGRREYPGLGLVTVYRTLERLEEIGLIQRVHQTGGCHRVLRANQGHQHLLLCTGCGKAVFFSGDNISPMVQSLASETGFAITDHWLQLFGQCQACQVR